MNGKKKINKALFFIVILFSILVSCQPKDEILGPVSLSSIAFDNDTIVFDTMFVSKASYTERLKIYNKEDKAIEINNIFLKSNVHNFEVVINGQELSQINKLKLLGQDSALVFITVTIDPNADNLPFLIQDSLVFAIDEGEKAVLLQAHGRNANFISDSILSCNSVWDSELPYVVEDSVKVPAGCSLTLEKGVKVYFNYGAKMIVEGNLIVNGTLDSHVVFSYLNDIAIEEKKSLGYWSGVYFKSGNTGVDANYFELRNSRDGLFFEPGFTKDSTFDVQLKNTIIRNHSNTGIDSKGPLDIKLENVEVSNCANACINLEGGANVVLQHSTLANYSGDFFRSTALLSLDNDYDYGGSSGVGIYSVAILNTAIVGNLSEEMEVPEDATITAVNSAFDTEITSFNNSNLLNESWDFTNKNNQNFIPDSTSVLIDSGNSIWAISQDINGNTRSVIPDVGAYEYTAD